MGKAWRRNLAIGTIAGVGVAVVAWLLFVNAARRFLVGRFDPVYAAPPAEAPQRPSGSIRLTVVARGLTLPTDVQFVPARPRTAVVAEKSGTARVVELTDSGVAKPGALVLERTVHSTSELGLLGLAFHPRYPENGLFYINENPDDGGALRTRVSEWHLPVADLGKRAALERRVILEVEQPYQNHNGGQLLFGPDGKLYVGLGDGGWKDDPHGHGQNLGTLLGAMLRIDVDQKSEGREYSIPADNPFVGREDARGEIWAYGLRNPWRYSFDPRGRLVVADVGQNLWEEVDLVGRGDNLGWKIREGRHCFPPEAECTAQGMVDPIFEYGRGDGKSITGGFVYTGSRVAALRRRYVVADFTSGRMWALSLPDDVDGATNPEVLGTWPRLFSTFARDAAGEVYVADYSGGEILRLDP